MPIAMADGNRGKTGGKKYFHLYMFDYFGERQREMETEVKLLRSTMTSLERRRPVFVDLELIVVHLS